MLEIRKRKSDIFIRKNVNLNKDQAEFLEFLSKEAEVSESEVMRQLLDNAKKERGL